MALSFGWLMAHSKLLLHSTQLYVIHALRGGPNPLEDGHLLPSLFVLLANKTEATYMRMWEQIQILCTDALPTHLIVDFEKAVINSFQHFWPTTNIKGCFFHLTQNIWRKVQAEGMQAQYNIDEDCSEDTFPTKSCFCLSFRRSSVLRSCG